MSLDVYLYGEQVGNLCPLEGSDYSLEFAPGCIDRYGPGSPVLSNSMPVSTEPYSPATTRAFVEGLLPSGMRRLKVARELEIDPEDGYSLLAEVGRDCAGGLSFLPAGTPPATPGPDPIPWASEDELEELVAAPPSRLFDPEREQRMRFALAGIRHKLALVRGRPGGRWAWPGVGRASTHIVKPENGEHPELVPNEAFCTAVARAAGLPAAPAAMEEIGGRKCLVSERFDRSGTGPIASRFHQETFAQALGFAPDAEPESEEADGPGFAESCGLLRAVGREDGIEDLLAMAFCNYILGNGDAHGENFALVLVPDGALLAPFYDIASTAVYDDPMHVGMTIAEDYDELACLLELAQICEEADLDFEGCRSLAADVAARMSSAIGTVARRAKDEGWNAPVVEAIAELATERALGLGYEVER